MAFRVTSDRTPSPPPSPAVSPSQGDEERRIKRRKVGSASPTSTLSPSSSSNSLTASPYGYPSPVQRNAPASLGKIDCFIAEKLLPRTFIARNLPAIKSEMESLLADVEVSSVKCKVYKAYGEALINSLLKEKDPTVMAELLLCLKKHEQFAKESGCGISTGEQLRLRAECFAICHAFPEEFLARFPDALENPKDIYRMALENFHRLRMGLDSARDISVFESTLKTIARHIEAIEYALNPENRTPVLIPYLSESLHGVSYWKWPSSHDLGSPPLLPTRRTESFPALDGHHSTAETDPALGVAESVDKELELLFSVFEHLKVKDISLVKVKIAEIEKKLTRREKAELYYGYAKALAYLYFKDLTNAAVKTEVVKCFGQARQFAYATNDMEVIADTAHFTGWFYGQVYDSSQEDGSSDFPAEYLDYAIKRLEEFVKNREGLVVDPTKRAQIQAEITRAENSIAKLRASLEKEADKLIERFKPMSFEDLRRNGIRVSITGFLGKLTGDQMVKVLFTFACVLKRFYSADKQQKFRGEAFAYLKVAENYAGGNKYLIGRIKILKADFYHDDPTAAGALYKEAKALYQGALEEYPSHKERMQSFIELIDKHLAADATSLSALETPLSLSVSVDDPSTHFMRGQFAENTDPSEALKHYQKALEKALEPLKTSIEAAIKRLSPPA